MKYLWNFIIGMHFILYSFILPSDVYCKQKGIGVVKGLYDDVGVILKGLRIPHSEIKYQDLEKEETYRVYRAIFFPCGMGSSIESGVNVLSRGRRIHAVLLREDQIEIDRERVYRNIESFMENGGSAYFSGFSYNFLQGAFNVFSFFDNFPNMGLAGKIDISPGGDLVGFCGAGKLSLQMPHSGWITVKSIRDAEIVAEGVFDTPRGLRKGPIAVIFKAKSGEILYTSFHDNSINELLRFIIYRVSYRYLLSELFETADKWNQAISSKIVDSIIGMENFRKYRLNLAKGANTIYFNSESSFFQADIYDEERLLIASFDPHKRVFHVNINSDRDQICRIKIFPVEHNRYKPYSVVSASGKRFNQNYKNVIYIFLVFLTVISIFLLKKYVFSKRFSGRV